MNASPLFLPIITLVLWSLVMLAWMAITRLPAIHKAGLPPSAGERTAELATLMDKRIQWKADNYNHLMEQPTLFYATALLLAMMGLGEGINLTLAWTYVVARVLHSIVQSTSNYVPLRFSIFAISTVALLAMAINALRALL
ncbi:MULTISPECIES: MAPEG family protein [Spongiibacter]|uniref:MAPEG family protein n=1 Tax=Spongiibacter TaxID=630749 RepID=UPI001B07FEA2|nr:MULTISPECIES: MAPEG family protein [Spongiibacter]MBO6751916.1 MAPEG family protein [Spongiibacter sp.]